MKLNLEELYKTNPLKACKLALRRTAHLKPDRIDAINTLLGLHGVEAIRGAWQNGYWCDIVATYCNTGDTYALTVVHSREHGFLITCVGYFVERYSEKLEIV